MRCFTSGTVFWSGAGERRQLQQGQHRGEPVVAERGSGRGDGPALVGGGRQHDEHGGLIGEEGVGLGSGVGGGQVGEGDAAVVEQAQSVGREALVGDAGVVELDEGRPGGGQDVVAHGIGGDRREGSAGGLGHHEQGVLAAAGGATAT